MSNDIAGSTILGKRGFAQTVIGDMNLDQILHSELEVRRDKILTAANALELLAHYFYATGVLRGFEIGETITAAQVRQLAEIFESTKAQRESELSEAGR